jgi:hypothetical protein
MKGAKSNTAQYYVSRIAKDVPLLTHIYLWSIRGKTSIGIKLCNSFRVLNLA